MLEILPGPGPGKKSDRRRVSDALNDYDAFPQRHRARLSVSHGSIDFPELLDGNLLRLRGHLLGQSHVEDAVLVACLHLGNLDVGRQLEAA